MHSGRYSYHLAPTSSHGLMRCAACNKHIAEGQYRVREKTEAYVTWHRACTDADPNWMKLDTEQHDRHVRNKAFQAACIAFRDKWGVTDLNDYIEEASDA